MCRGRYFNSCLACVVCLIGCGTSIPVQNTTAHTLAKYVESIDPSYPTVSGTILIENAEQVGILVNRGDQGEAVQVTGIHYEDANNIAFTVLLGADGLPESLVIEGWVVRFHDYTADSVMADVIGPDGNSQTLSASITDSRYLDALRNLAQSGLVGSNAKSTRVEKAGAREAKLSTQDQTKAAGLILGSISCGIGVAQMLAPTGVSQITGALTILGCGATIISAIGAELGLAGTALDIISCGDDIAEFSPVLAVVDCTNLVLGIVQGATKDQETIVSLAPEIVSALSFDPSGRSFTDHIEVSISSATPGASIRYTIDGSIPTPSTGILYTGPIPLAASITLTAIAYKDGMKDSEVRATTYTFNAASSTQPLLVETDDRVIHFYVAYQMNSVVSPGQLAARIYNGGTVAISNLHVASMVSQVSSLTLDSIIDTYDDGILNGSLLPQRQLEISSNGYDPSAPFTAWSTSCPDTLAPRSSDPNAFAYFRLRIPVDLRALSDNNTYAITIEGNVPDPVTPGQNIVVSSKIILDYLVAWTIYQ